MLLGSKLFWHLPIYEHDDRKIRQRTRHYHSSHRISSLSKENQTRNSKCLRPVVCMTIIAGIVKFSELIFALVFCSCYAISSWREIRAKTFVLNVIRFRQWNASLLWRRTSPCIVMINGRVWFYRLLPKINIVRVHTTDY